MSEHLEGRSVNSNTYSKYGCRCDGCRAAAVGVTRRNRQRNGMPPSQTARNKANGRAVKWLQEHRPEVWEQIMAEEYAIASSTRPAIPPRSRNTP